MGRTWLITGCSSGFGKLLGERALMMGDSVVATARATQALADMGRDNESRILRLALDVSNPDQIRQAVDRAIDRFGAIDVLVNNAGYGYFASHEEAELQEVRTMFDVNVFGTIGMTQGVLPHMRERGSGTIITMSSVAGRITTPRGGFYQASKWAVEALSESLYLEVSAFGIRVIVIEPGAYENDFGLRSARIAAADGDPDSPYAGLRERWRQRQRERIFPYRQYPAEVVDGVFDAIDSDLPFVRLPIGRDATELIDRRTAMGHEFVEWMRSTYNDPG